MLTTNPEFVSQEFVTIRKAASSLFKLQLLKTLGKQKIQDWLLASDEQDTFVASSFKKSLHADVGHVLIKYYITRNQDLRSWF